ncbi:MAG: hypothetical protein EON58_04970 [Alphaproteobacteria bacterium]|nr:MAG: hypothetical protein EON58_04970 [Alphaproteobacteria bacterium]
MADAYLNLAERILREERRPLRPREMIELGYKAAYIPWHLHGPRQDKTLHARLSEDISRSPDNGTFVRTGAGEFFLRQFLAEPDIAAAYKRVYLAPPRRKELRRDWVLCLKQSAIDSARSVISASEFQQLVATNGFEYASHSRVGSGDGVVAVRSFVMVFRENEILTYRVGKFTAGSDMLRRPRSIGVGGNVYAGDSDLFDRWLGAVSNGIQELCYGIGLSRRLAEEARYTGGIRPILGVLSQPAEGGAKSFSLVMIYECPDEFAPSAGALSVNDLRWATPTQMSNDLSDFDPLSEQLLSELWPDISRLRHVASA